MCDITSATFSERKTQTSIIYTFVIWKKVVISIPTPKWPNPPSAQVPPNNGDLFKNTALRMLKSSIVFSSPTSANFFFVNCYLDFQKYQFVLPTYERKGFSQAARRAQTAPGSRAAILALSLANLSNETYFSTVSNLLLFYFICLQFHCDTSLSNGGGGSPAQHRVPPRLGAANSP